MESNSTQLDVELMVRAKSYVESLPSKLQNTESVNILNMISNYLHAHCQHNIITDQIDVDPDRSETIRYCDKCMHTFK